MNDVVAVADSDAKGTALSFVRGHGYDLSAFPKLRGGDLLEVTLIQNKQ